jgi:hypothetical protein
MITSQLPVNRWREIIGDPTYADAILDRLVHNTHRIQLAGGRMRRTRGKQNQKARPDTIAGDKNPPASEARTRAASFCYGGGIIQESRAALSRYTRAASSEAAS